MSLFKPFKPPSFKNGYESAANIKSSEEEDPERPAKRQKLSGGESSDSNINRNAPKLVFKKPGVSSLPRKPLDNVTANTAAHDGGVQTAPGCQEQYYNVLWRKYTIKKNKTWDGDGILRVADGFAYLQDTSGRILGRTACSAPLLPESGLSISGKEVEVESILSRGEYLKRRPSPKHSISEQNSVPTLTRPLPLPAKTVVSKAGVDIRKEGAEKLAKASIPCLPTGQRKWKSPLLTNTVQEQEEGDAPTPRHDPSVPGAIVMTRPKSVPKGRQVVDVVIDPILSRQLREHQKAGVKFMYECVMGMRDFQGEGCILADEMGLGKTLQTIALIWTLMKQNPVHGNPPVVRKALIVCPASLTNNWKKEFKKWLGNERIGVFVADDDKYKRITDFTKGRAYNVIIIGYEKLRNVQEELKKGVIDIIVADEGHRLKTAKNKSAEAIKSLNTERRIILSGTPLQNDLSEFFTMVDFVNPGILGSFKAFTREFDVPINRSRQPEATKKEIEKGAARSEELASITTLFILRRTADLLSRYLPTRTEYVLLCSPTRTQTEVYRHILRSQSFQLALGAPETYLQIITLLKKVCNSPSLLNGNLMADVEKDKTQSPMTTELVSSIPLHLLRNPSSSAKLRVLDDLLHAIHTQTSEKVVLVSNFTSTLDLLSQLLTANGMPFLRLDGSTPTGKRQDLVDAFNRTPARHNFAFLLSAKAGGLGLNLVGASRLVLFDVDWNPAIDAQAMARIHRDGQKRRVFVYRMLLAGALDEKIWQRQVTKVGLASSVVDNRGGVSSFTKEELKDLFRLELRETPGCQTHDLLRCRCQGRGLPDGNDVQSEGVARDGDDDDDDDDDDQSLPEFPMLLKSSEVDMEQQERRIADEKRRRRGKKGQPDLQGLMSYAHIDTAELSGDAAGDLEALMTDHILLKVIKDLKAGGDLDVPFLFTKTIGGQVPETS